MIMTIDEAEKPAMKSVISDKLDIFRRIAEVHRRICHRMDDVHRDSNSAGRHSEIEESSV